MAVFTINSASSNVTNANGAPAFTGDSAAADTLTVDASAHLIALGTNSAAAFLANTLGWKVTVNGWLFSQSFAGIHLAPGNTATSTITIRADGEVGSGSGRGIHAQSAVTIVNSGVVTGRVDVESATTIINNASGTISGSTSAIGIFGPSTTIKNAGTITSGGFAIEDVNGFGNDNITNGGIINGALALNSGNNTLVNSGTISDVAGVGAYQGGSGNDTIRNSKTILGAIDLGSGNNVLTNSGTIVAVGTAIEGGAGTNTVTNSREIVGDIFLGGTSSLTNSGTITGTFTFNGGNDTLVNSRTISSASGGGTASMGNGDNTIVNKGRIDFGELVFGAGNDTLTNRGVIDAEIKLGGGTNLLVNAGTLTGGGAIQILGGSGVDTVTNSGTIAGIVDLGAGDDVFNGGNSAETIRDAEGSDTFNFGGGNDTYLARRTAGTDGTDLVDGGNGIDTYDASGTGTVHINLDTVDHDFAQLGFPGLNPVAKNTANGSGVDGGGGTKDTILNFENAQGSNSGDIIYGSAAANVIEGNGGNDFLFAFGGNDTLLGGAGEDNLVGGAGRDTLDGGLDGAFDRFVYTALSDSTVGKAGRDQIVNFEQGFDAIDLQGIDARSGTPADDAFVYLNGNSLANPAVAFSGNGVGGELRSVWTATGFVLEGDVNGDGNADFAIDIVDPNHTIILTSADFAL